MKILKLIAFCSLLLCLNSCQKNSFVALRDVERGLFLERASSVSTSTFFNRRMDNQNSHNDWIIVNQDLENVYFGRLIHEQNNYVMVKPFYKTNKEKLEKKFPGFVAIDGNSVKTKVFNEYIKSLITERLLPICPQSYSVDYPKRNIDLTKNGIVSDIKLYGKCYEDKIFSAKLKILLSPEDLKVLNEEIIIK